MHALRAPAWRSMPANTTAWGNDCITLAHDTKAALANYDKGAGTVSPPSSMPGCARASRSTTKERITKQPTASMKPSASVRGSSRRCTTGEKTASRWATWTGPSPTSTGPHRSTPTTSAPMNSTATPSHAPGKPTSCHQWAIAERLREKKEPIMKKYATKTFTKRTTIRPTSSASPTCSATEDSSSTRRTRATPSAATP